MHIQAEQNIGMSILRSTALLQLVNSDSLEGRNREEFHIFQVMDSR